MTRITIIGEPGNPDICTVKATNGGITSCYRFHLCRGRIVQINRQTPGWVMQPLHIGQKEARKAAKDYFNGLRDL